MTLARYNNAKECFVMKLKQNSANCSIDIIWAMWVTMNDNTTGYTMYTMKKGLSSILNQTKLLLVKRVNIS